MEIYLDNSATTKVLDEAAKKAYEIMVSDFGNPSSLHHMGMVAEKEIKYARKAVADLMGREDKGLYFTSSGTEANNLAIMGAARSMIKRGNKIITSNIEHPSVLEPCRRLEKEGFEVVYLKTDGDGIIRSEQLEKAIDEKTVLVSIMTANNETGSLQPLSDIAKFKDRYNFIFHTDMVQAYGKVSPEYVPDGVDIITVSGHKVHAPKGVGAIWIKEKVNIKPLMLGGGQEKGMRSGTENVPAIAAFGIAADVAKRDIDENINNMCKVRDYLWNGIKAEIPNVKLNTPLMNSVSSVLNVSFAGIRAEVLLHTLEQDGIYVSTGSACSSNKKNRSHVLRALNLKPSEIESAIRFSFSRYNTVEDMDTVILKLEQAVSKFRKLGSFR